MKSFLGIVPILPLTFRFALGGLVAVAALASGAAAAERLALEGERLNLSWEKQAGGWRLRELAVTSGGKRQTLKNPLGEFTHLFATKPSLSLAALDLGHGTQTYFPAEARRLAEGGMEFRHATADAEIVSVWRLDPARPDEIMVRTKLIAKKTGAYSLATPVLADIAVDDLAWGLIPGAWYGPRLQSDRELAVSYSQGIPDRPALSFERNTMTLCGILSTKNGISVGVVPEPGTGADPWPQDKMDRVTTKVGITLMNRHLQLFPTAYAPVHGGEGSRLNAGESVEFAFRYVIKAGDWFSVFKGAAEDIYGFSGLLKRQRSTQSLSERVARMQTFLQDERKSKWRTLTIKGTEIGMYGSKNSDIGAMLMIERASDDRLLREERLPLVREFKLQQQETRPGFFQYAAIGEYPTEPSAGVVGPEDFVSEIGNWVEPLYTTIYTLCDMGNMVLFNPADEELKARIRGAADRLLRWQHKDGGFDVAYDRNTHRLVFPHLKDYRPTWYGFIVAHRILGDAKYLAAARKGADWFVRNAVANGHYLGACGDSLNKWDFTTAQAAQALLDIYDLTGDRRYRDAAIETAKAYATSIFTHPVPTDATKLVGGIARKDWEITQVGLGVEHIRGTASGAGPIYLASHAGLFVRIFDLTGERLFLDMARAAARGRSAAADVESGEAIYYWRMLENVPRFAPEFPWHAWWQIGWITDYLLAEVAVRTKGRVAFPRGFVTPKVGPHQTYGFAPGQVYGEKADLWLPSGLIKIDSPDVEYVGMKAVSGGRLFVTILNQLEKDATFDVTIDPGKIDAAKSVSLGQARFLEAPASAERSSPTTWKVTLPAWGYAVLSVDYR